MIFIVHQVDLVPVQQIIDEINGNREYVQLSYINANLNGKEVRFPLNFNVREQRNEIPTSICAECDEPRVLFDLVEAAHLKARRAEV